MRERCQLPCQSRCLLLGALAGSFVTRVACRASSHPNPEHYFSDAPVVEPGRVNAYGWTQSFKAGTKGLNGTELLHLTEHAGKLFAGTGFWMHKTPLGAQVLRLDSPNGDWVVDTILYASFAQRTEILKVINFATDGHGAALSSPVQLLAAGFYLNYAGTGKCGIVVRNDAAQLWEHTWYYEKSPFRPNYFSARALESYRDKVTGVDYVFISAGMPGIIKGRYDPSLQPPIRFDSATESGQLPTRPLSLVTMGGSLYTTAGGTVLRRTDGSNPTWSVVLNMADHASETVDEAVGGLRGITAIPHGAGESLLFAWCPNGKSKACMVRLDPAGGGFTVTQEGCVKQLAGQILGADFKMPYALANYNFALPLQSTTGLVHIVGFQVLLYSYSVDDHPTDPGQESMSDNGKSMAYYAGAGFLVRKGPGNYEVRVPGGPRQCVSQINPPLVAVRCHAKSPWDDSVYLGGYDANFFDSPDRAWVLHGSAAAVHSQPVPQLGSGVCTTTTTATTRTTTTSTLTTTTPPCSLCLPWSRQDHWIDMSGVETASSVNPTQRRKVLDGNHSTWGGAVTYIMDLKANYHLSKIRVEWRSCHCMQDGAVFIVGSVDGQTWTTLERPNLLVWGHHDVRTYDVDFYGRYVALNITENVPEVDHQYITIWEIALRGFVDFDPRPYVLDADKVVIGANSNYSCQSGQDYFNDHFLSNDIYDSVGGCGDVQLFYKDLCCIPTASSTKTASTSSSTTSSTTGTLTPTTATRSTSLTTTSTTVSTTSATATTTSTTTSTTSTTAATTTRSAIPIQVPVTQTMTTTPASSQQDTTTATHAATSTTTRTALTTPTGTPTTTATITAEQADVSSATSTTATPTFTVSPAAGTTTTAEGEDTEDTPVPTPGPLTPSPSPAPSPTSAVESWMLMRVSSPQDFVKSPEVMNAIQAAVASAAGVPLEDVTVLRLTPRGPLQSSGLVRAEVKLTVSAGQEEAFRSAWQASNLTALTALMSSALEEASAGTFTAGMVQVGTARSAAREQPPQEEDHSPAIVWVLIPVLLVCGSIVVSLWFFARFSHKTAPDLDFLNHKASTNFSELTRLSKEPYLIDKE